MTLSLRAMRYVQAAMQHCSIAAAADDMHVAPSAISAALNQAEEAFGFALVTRARSKGIFPTVAGRTVLRGIDDLLERYDFFLAEVSDLQSGFTGSLRIGYNAPIAPAFLPDISAKLIAEHPEISLLFKEGDNDSVQQALLDGQVDAIIFVSELPNPQIEAMPLIYAPTYCLCASDHLFAQQEAVTIDQIVREPLILVDRPAAHGYYLDLINQSAHEPQIVATTNSTEMARSLVAASIGVTLLNMKPGDVGTYAGRDVCCIPIEGAKGGVTISVATAKGPRRELLQVFLNACITYFETQDVSRLIVPEP